MSPSVRPLRPELEEVARRELNEDPARRDQDLAHIKEWLKKQPHIKARTDDQWLLSFLRGCKFSLERTKEKLDTYYTVRTLLPELFSNRDPMLPELQEILKQGTHLPMKSLDEKGRRIIFMRAVKDEAGVMKVANVMKMNFMIMDIGIMEDDDLIINGSNGVMDCADMTLALILQMTPSMAKKINMVFQEAYPIRPKMMHHINFPNAMQTIFNMWKSFMKEKLKKRIFVHADMDALLTHIPKRALPKEYGGDGESLAEMTEYWKAKVESYRDWFMEDEKNKTDEKKRVGRPKTHETMFGLEGSFRPLNVD